MIGLMRVVVSTLDHVTGRSSWREKQAHDADTANERRWGLGWRKQAAFALRDGQRTGAPGDSSAADEHRRHNPPVA